MKKMIRVLLCLVLAASMVMTSALAEQVSLFDTEIYSDDSKGYTEDENNTYRLQTAITCGKTIYMVVSVDLINPDEEEYVPSYFQLWQWKDGMARPECVADHILYCSYYDGNQSLEESFGAIAPGADFNHPITTLFSDGKQLLSYNVATGAIYYVIPNNNTLEFTDITTAQDSSIFKHVSSDYTQIKYVRNACVAGGKILFSFNDWDDNTGETINDVYTVDMKDGSTKKASIGNVEGMTGYKDGKVLLAAREEPWDSVKQKMNPYQLYAYNPADDTAEKLFTLTPDTDVNGSWAYSENLDSVITLQNNKIYAYKDEKTVKQVGYLPVSYTYGIDVVGDSGIFKSNSGVYKRILNPDFSADDYINVYSGWMGDGERKFVRENPQTPMYMINDDYYTSVDQIGNAMVSGDSSLDVLGVYANTGMFPILKSKGYCLDLSGNAVIKEYVDNLYEPFKNYVMEDGKIYGIPVDPNSYHAWYVNKAVMTEMGLTMEDLPHNLVELCAFAQKWNDEWTDKYPNYTLLEYCGDHKGEIFDTMVKGYLNHCTAKGEQIDLTSPCFREMMETVDKLHLEELDKHANTENEDEVGYREALLMTNYSAVGSFNVINDSYRIYIDMGLCSHIPHEENVDLRVIFINPKSKHTESAMKYLECQITAMNDVMKHTLLSTETEPVLNEYYDKYLQSEQKYLAQLKQLMEEAETEEIRHDMQEQIKMEEEYLASFEKNNKYSISEDSIKFYVDTFVPNMYVTTPTFTASSGNEGDSELTVLMNRYKQGQISMQQFINEAGNKVRMMQMEMQ